MMNYQEQAIISKYGLTIPLQHKFLSYVSNPLDLMLFCDNLDAFKSYHEKYPDVLSETTLRACVEYGAVSCFNYFFETTKSKKHYFEKLFLKPEIPTLGILCPFYHVRNNNIINAISQLCEKLFPSKIPLDFFKDQEQIEHCSSRFGIKSRVKIAEQLLDKLESPLFMINNIHVFECLYTNKAEKFCNIYLNKIEEKNLIEPLLLSMFSTPDIGNRKTYINFFDRFTKEKNNPNYPIHDLVNDFLVKNIKNNSISHEFQELMIAYCLRNNNYKDLNLYFEARPFNKQQLLSNLKDPWKHSCIQHQPYRQIKEKTTYGVDMTNNALKLFHYNESIINIWIETLKELNVPSMISSTASLFCLGDKTSMKESLELLFSYIDWNQKDEGGNNFSHYLAKFHNKMDRKFPEKKQSKDMLSFVLFLIQNKPEVLIEKNNDGVISGEEFLNTIKNSKSMTLDNSSNKAQRDELEKLLNYVSLHNQLNFNTASSKRIKI